MIEIDVILLVGAVVLIAAIIAARIGARVGLPSLLLFLGSAWRWVSPASGSHSTMPSWHRRSACGSGRDSRRGRSHHTVERHQAHDDHGGIAGDGRRRDQRGLDDPLRVLRPRLAVLDRHSCCSARSPPQPTLRRSSLCSALFPSRARHGAGSRASMMRRQCCWVMLASSFASRSGIGGLAFRVSSADRARAARRHGHRWRPWLARCADSASRRTAVSLRLYPLPWSGRSSRTASPRSSTPAVSRPCTCAL